MGHEILAVGETTDRKIILLWWKSEIQKIGRICWNFWKSVSATV